jgi:tRNA(Arg) A34 adenosine deaminase TadA
MIGAAVTARDDLLRRAIELAATARKSGNPPFGSLLAGPDGTVIAEDHNTSITDNDISAHPELKLAKWAADDAHLNLPRPAH